MKQKNNTGRDQIYYSQTSSIVVKPDQIIDHPKALYGLTPVDEKAEADIIVKPASTPAATSAPTATETAADGTATAKSTGLRGR